MGKAIFAMLATIIAGVVSSIILENWIHASEWGIIVAVAVMGAFIICYNEKK